MKAAGLEQAFVAVFELLKLYILIREASSCHGMACVEVRGQLWKFSPATTLVLGIESTWSGLVVSVFTC